MSLLRWADAVNGYVLALKGDTTTSTQLEPDLKGVIVEDPELRDLIANFRACASAYYYGYLQQNSLTTLDRYPKSVKRFLESIDVGTPGGSEYLATVQLDDETVKCKDLLEQIKAKLA